jgi:hypothetical protein
MSAPIKRISPELDEAIKRIATQKNVNYITASKFVADKSVMMEETTREIRDIFKMDVGIFKRNRDR